MNTRTRNLVLATLLLPGAALTSGHAQGTLNLVLNPSFESPALTNGNNATGSGANWTATGGGDPEIITNGYGTTASYGTTPYGNQWFYFDKGAVDSQTISGSFTLNTVYTLSLVCADVRGQAGDSLTLTATGGGMTAAATRTFSIPQNPSLGKVLPFVTYSLAFTPITNAAVTISFTNSATGQSLYSMAVDNVVLVPEPSTWTLLGGGGLAVGLVWFLRQRASA